MESEKRKHRDCLPTEEELAVLQARQDYYAGQRMAPRLPSLEYQMLVGSMGERCAAGFLSTEFPGATVINANAIKANCPGYDLVVAQTRSARVSVKASTDVECFGWWQKPSTKSLDCDVVLLLDFGRMVTPKGRYAKYGLKVFASPAAYVIPKDTLRGWLKHPPRTRGHPIHRWKRKPSPGDAALEVPELDDWRDRFDIVERLIE